MPTSGKRGSLAKASKPQIDNFDTKELPSRKALMQLSKSKKTLNDYSKAAPTVVTGPATDEG